MSKLIAPAVAFAVLLGAGTALAQDATTQTGDQARDTLREQTGGTAGGTGRGAGQGKGKTFLDRQVPDNAFGSHVVHDPVTGSFRKFWNPSLW